MSAKILDITAAQYHADPCATPSLSASLAKILATRSPAHAYAAHPRLGGASHAPTEAMSAGTLVHAMILEAGRGVEIIDADSYRTNAAKAARAAATAAGKLPILAVKYAEISEAVRCIRDRLDAAGVILDGVPEQAIEWHDATADGEPVICRSMIDHRKGETIYDLKTTGDASPEAFARSIATYGYDIQVVAYERAAAALDPDLAGRTDFLFVAVELEAPYAVGVYRPAGDVREIGARRWERAVETWARCLRTGQWPDYSAGAKGVPYVSLPTWMLRQEEGRDGDE